MFTSCYSDWSWQLGAALGALVASAIGAPSMPGVGEIRPHGANKPTS